MQNQGLCTVTMLNGTLVLHDPRCTQNGHGCHHGCITDVERMCGALLERKSLRVGDRDYEDTLSFLIAESWQHANRYRPELDTGPNSNMAAFIKRRLAFSFANQKRSNYRTIWKSKGYTYRRALPQFVTPSGQELEQAVGRGSLAPEVPGSSSLGRLLRNRAGTAPRENTSLDTGPTQAAA